jgi:hypothetical protein
MLVRRLQRRSKRADDNPLHRPIVLRMIAGDRGHVPGLGVDARELDLEACLSSEDFQKGTLRTAIAIEKAVDGVQLEICSAARAANRWGGRPRKRSSALIAAKRMSM